MRQFIIKRLLATLVLVFLSATIIFVMLRLVPGGPWDHIYAQNPRLPLVGLRRLNALIGLDRPIHEQYVSWITAVVSGDMGTAWATGAGRSVLSVVLDRLPYTLLLMTVATAISVALAVLIGVYSATHPYSTADNYLGLFAFFGISMPTFWLSLLSISLFAVILGWLPTGGVVTPALALDMDGDLLSVLRRLLTLGRAEPQIAGHEWALLLDGAKHLVLPVGVVALTTVARWSRYVRTATLEVLSQDYVRTARAKGVREPVVIYKHTLRNALIPIITIVGLELPSLFTGTIVVEIIFSWPGMGQLLLQSLRVVDWPVLQALLIVAALVIILSNLLTDVLYAVVDPRIRYP